MKLSEMNRRDFVKRTGAMAAAGSRMNPAAIAGRGTPDIKSALAAYQASQLDDELMWNTIAHPGVPGFVGWFSQEELEVQPELEPFKGEQNPHNPDEFAIVIPKDVLTGYIVDLAKHTETFLQTLTGEDGRIPKYYDRDTDGLYSKLMSKLCDRLGPTGIMNALSDSLHVWYDFADAIDNGMGCMPKLAGTLSKVGITPENWLDISRSTRAAGLLEKLGVRVPDGLKEQLSEIVNQRRSQRQNELERNRQQQNQQRDQAQRQRARPARPDLEPGMHQDWDEFLEGLRRSCDRLLRQAESR